MKEGHEFLEGTHRYERTFSDNRTGEIKVMNGREAKELNDYLFAKFIKAADTNVKGRSLEKWKLVEKFVEPKVEQPQ